MLASLRLVVVIRPSVLEDASSMLAIPVPFVVALALFLLLAVALGQQDRPSRSPLTGFLVLAVVQSVLVGLRWSSDLPIVRFVLPITASLLPPLAWASADGLHRKARGTAARVVVATTLLAVLLLTLFWRRPIDIVLALIEAGYGLAILNIARLDADELKLARLVDAPRIRPVILSLGGLLIASAIADGIVAVDFAWFDGTIAPVVIAVAGLATLAVLAFIVALIGRSLPAGGTQHEERGERAAGERAPASASHAVINDPEPDDLAVMGVVTRLMCDGALYRDADLTLERLARRAALPARTISNAINRTHRQNVSQFVNGFRVSEAQRLLDTSDRPVTTIMFDVGFQTKSNFNREFRRLAGCSPTEWRHRNRQVVSET